MFYPDMGAPSACIYKYMQQLKNIYDFHVITKTEETDFIPNKEFNILYISNVTHRIRNWCYRNLKTNKYKILSRSILLAINAIKLFQTQFMFPSAQKWEVDEYLNQLEILNSHTPIDVVIPVSNTFVSQLAMLKFKKRHPKIKWIAFITDPYSKHYIYYRYKLLKNFWKRLNLKKEQEIYSNCDYAMFTTEMYRYISTAFDIDFSKVNKIEFTLQNYKEAHSKKERRDASDICKLIYAGLFYKEIRNPEFALKSISQVSDISLDLYVNKGECEDIISKYASDNIHRYEYVSHDRYLQMIHYEYDVLINVGNNATLQAPSKMLELLSTGKPIINFYHVKDSQYEMIERYPLGINIGKNDALAVEMVNVFCRQMKGKQISFEEVQNLFPENDLNKQVELLRNLIEA